MKTKEIEDIKVLFNNKSKFSIAERIYHIYKLRIYYTENKKVILRILIKYFIIYYKIIYAIYKKYFRQDIQSRLSVYILGLKSKSTSCLIILDLMIEKLKLYRFLYDPNEIKYLFIVKKLIIAIHFYN